MTNNKDMIQAQNLEAGDIFETADGTAHEVMTNRDLEMTGRNRITTTEGKVIIARHQDTFHLNS